MEVKEVSATMVVIAIDPNSYLGTMMHLLEESAKNSKT